MHLALQNGKSIYLLVRHPDCFRIAPAEDAPDKTPAAESDCESIPVEQLHSVVFSGNRAGEQVFLYVGTQERKFTLLADTTEETLEAVFAGIELIRTSSSLDARVREPDWRESMQNESVRKITRVVGIGLNLFLLLSSWKMVEEQCLLLELERLFPIWTILASATMVILLTMFVTMPQYFTLCLNKLERDEIGCTAKVTNLRLLFPALFFAACNAFRQYTSWLYVLAMIALISYLIFKIACKICRALQEDSLQRFIFVAILACFLFGTVGNINDCANPDRYAVRGHRIVRINHASYAKERHIMRVYHCTVETPSGRTIRMMMRRFKYESIEPGDHMVGYIGTGALGIEYGYSVDPPW